MEGPAARRGGGGRGGGGGGGYFERLPEECISRILFFTSPPDVCRSSAVSRAFRRAAASNFAWDRFLPPDFREILNRSSSPVVFSSRKDLYFRLCDSIAIDGGSMRAWLEKPTGKKCYMLSARVLGITSGGDARYWRWISVPDARFPEVAELLDVCWLEIRGSISSRDLSPGTRYGAYLVMRLSDSSYGLHGPPQGTVITVGGVPSSTRWVRIQERRRHGAAYHLRGAALDYPWLFPPDVGDAGEEEDEVIGVPRPRGDGWMELDMGDFFIEAGGEGLVVVRLNGGEGLRWKSGLIVHGIEVRPVP